MHKLAKGLKKKKKQKKGKKGTEEDEFEPEELERYRRERAEAQKKLSEEISETNTGSSVSDEWKKFEALTAGVDSILKKSQGDLDRIKSTSFFQRKAPEENKKAENKGTAEKRKNQSKKWVGFDKDGNPIAAHQENEITDEIHAVNEDGFVNVPDDEDGQEDSSEEDIFDTTYVDVLQNADVQLAYIPDSPTDEVEGDDPFDTTNAEKVLKTVDKKGKKLVSLGNAVEVLAGRIDHVSTCKLRTIEQPKSQNLLLDDDGIPEISEVVNSDTNVLEINKTLLDDDSDVLEITADVTNLPTIVPVVSSIFKTVNNSNENKPEIPLDISEFEVFKERTILEKIPDLDDSEFDLNTAADVVIVLQETEDPFSAKELPSAEFQNEIVEASFEVATFANEEDPFDTTFADNILPGKIELKFIEKELQELPESEVSISLTDPAGLYRDYDTGLLKNKVITTSKTFLVSAKEDLLGSSATDLDQLYDQPIQPSEEITYIDPFNTSCVQDFTPGQTELKFLEKELLGENTIVRESLEDDDFNPRKEEKPIKVVVTVPQSAVENSQTIINKVDEVNQVVENSEALSRNCKTSRPEVLEIAYSKVVAFELPVSTNRPDLLSTSKEENAINSKPLTPYYCQKSLEETLPLESEPDQEVDPFDTSFVSKVAPSKTELKLIESELLKTETSQPNNTIQSSADKEQTLKQYIKQEEKKKASIIKKQESILDTEIKVDIKPLTPEVETKTTEEEVILYADPFDTSIATNILPGKAELKLLENELNQVSEQVQVRLIPINLVKVKIPGVLDVNELNSNFGETEESKDFFSLGGNNPGDKILTPLQEKQLFTEEVDPFDTSFAAVGLGKTELKLLESELINK